MKLFSGQTTDPINWPVIPSVVFTSPRIAKAGVTVEEADQKGFNVTDTDLTANWYYQVDKESIAESKQVHDKAGHIVGVTEISDQAQDSINTLLPAIELKLDQEQIDRMVNLFPAIGFDAWSRAQGEVTQLDPED